MLVYLYIRWESNSIIVQQAKTSFSPWLWQMTASHPNEIHICGFLFFTCGKPYQRENHYSWLTLLLSHLECCSGNVTHNRAPLNSDLMQQRTFLTSPSQNSVGDFAEGRGIINTETHRFELEIAPLSGNKVIPSQRKLASDTGRILLLRLKQQDWLAACWVHIIRSLPLSSNKDANWVFTLNFRNSKGRFKVILAGKVEFMFV